MEVAVDGSVRAKIYGKSAHFLFRPTSSATLTEWECQWHHLAIRTLQVPSSRQRESITALSPGNPIDNTYLSAHHSGLWLNYTASSSSSSSSSSSDTSCALVNGVATVPARPWAIFLHDNDTTVLSLYNGPNEPGSSGSWQTVYDDRSAGLLRYRGLPSEAPPTDAWPDAVSGWMQSTPTVGGNVELLWQGARLWACDLGDAWRVSTQEWKVFPMGTRGCVQFIARIVREGGEEPALECVYSADY